MQLALAVQRVETRWRLIALIARLLDQLGEFRAEIAENSPSSDPPLSPLGGSANIRAEFAGASPTAHSPTSANFGDFGPRFGPTIEQWLGAAWVACGSEQLLCEALLDCAATALRALTPSPPPPSANSPGALGWSAVTPSLGVARASLELGKLCQ